MSKKIYILLATYNGKKYIKEQIDSILNQTYKNWQLIIHDDNSSDETIEIIKKYVNKYPEKIVFLDDNISTGGAKENFTFLLNNIDDKYDYIMFADQDDVWLTNKIQLTIDKMHMIERKNTNKPILIHTDLTIVDDKLNIIDKSYFCYQKINPYWSKRLDVSIVQNSITGCTLMLNKLAVNCSLPIESEAIMHDWWILLKVLKNDGIVDFVEESTILYRQHANNDTGAKGFSIVELFKKIDSFSKYKLMSDKLGLHYSYLDIIIKKIKILFSRIKENDCH